MGAPGNIPGESNSLQVEIPCAIFFILTPAFVIIRLWARVKLRTGLGVDDWTLLASFACCVAVGVLMMVSVYFGFGQHIYNLSPANRQSTLKLFYVAQIFYKLTINLTKASILLLYLRIFPPRSFRITCLVLLGIILLYMLGTTASSIWQCTPIERAWDRTLPGSCISLTANWYANAAFSITTDVLIILLPQKVIWQSQLPSAQKKALMCVFALGGFVTVTSVLRMTTLSFSTTTPDVTFDIASTLWTMIEMHVAIICACLPMCRLPLAYLFPTTLGSTAKSSTFGSSGSSTAGGRRSGSMALGKSMSGASTAWDGQDDEEKAARSNYRAEVVRRTSEEIMLRPLSAILTRLDDGLDLGTDDGSAGPSKRDSGIRKTTWFELKCEDEPATPGRAL